LNDLIKLQVVSLSPSASGATSYILFLQADNREHLGFPMVIGLNEAQAISMFMEGIIPARPLTHDLFSNFIKQSNMQLVFVEIEAFLDGVFIAKMHLLNQTESIILDARPSDSIAIALRLQVDIRINEKLLKEIAIPMDVLHDEQGDIEVNELSIHEVIANLEENLEKALANENYEEAAKLRDQLNQLTK
jgi:bifunctional DNase/RNase